jgi:large subunit ribosomal protein L29
MRTVKAKELRDLSVEELRERERGLYQELFNLRIQKATGQLGNTAMLGKTKKDLARVKTLLSELEMSREGVQGKRLE